MYSGAYGRILFLSIPRSHLKLEFLQNCFGILPINLLKFKEPPYFYIPSPMTHFHYEGWTYDQQKKNRRFIFALFRRVARKSPLFASLSLLHILAILNVIVLQANNPSGNGIVTIFCFVFIFSNLTFNSLTLRTDVAKTGN